MEKFKSMRGAHGSAWYYIKEDVVSSKPKGIKLYKGLKVEHLQGQLNTGDLVQVHDITCTEYWIPGNALSSDVTLSEHTMRAGKLMGYEWLKSAYKLKQELWASFFGKKDGDRDFWAPPKKPKDK